MSDINESDLFNDDDLNFDDLQLEQFDESPQLDTPTPQRGLSFLRKSLSL